MFVGTLVLKVPSVLATPSQNYHFTNQINKMLTFQGNLQIKLMHPASHNTFADCLITFEFCDLDLIDKKFSYKCKYCFFVFHMIEKSFKLQQGLDYAAFCLFFLNVKKGDHSCS